MSTDQPVSPDAEAARGPLRRRQDPKGVALAVAADVASLLLFVVLGRNAHDEGNAITGTLVVVAPFLIGAAVGWVVARAWRTPFEAWPAGTLVWITTLVVGLLLRRFVLDGDGERGTAVAFVIVTTLFTALFMLGWRLTATELRRRRRHPPTTHP